MVLSGRDRSWFLRRTRPLLVTVGGSIVVCFGEQVRQILLYLDSAVNVLSHRRHCRLIVDMVWISIIGGGFVNFEY